MAEKRKREPYAAIYAEVLETTATLTNEQFGELMRAALKHRFYRSAYSGDDKAVAMAFGFIARQIDRAAKVSQERSEAGAVGGSANKQTQANASNNKQEQPPYHTIPYHTIPYHTIPSHTIPSEAIPSEAIPSEAIPSEATKAGKTEFDPPTLDEIREYASSSGLDIDPCEFSDYYAARGWMMGNTQIRDWKAALRSWARKEGRFKPQNREPSTLDTLLQMARGGEH